MSIIFAMPGNFMEERLNFTVSSGFRDSRFWNSVAALCTKECRYCNFGHQPEFSASNTYPRRSGNKINGNPSNSPQSLHNSSKGAYTRTGSNLNRGQVGMVGGFYDVRRFVRLSSRPFVHPPCYSLWYRLYDTSIWPTWHLRRSSRALNQRSRYAMFRHPPRRSRSSSGSSEIRHSVSEIFPALPATRGDRDKFHPAERIYPPNPDTVHRGYLLRSFLLGRSNKINNITRLCHGCIILSMSVWL